MPVANCMLTNIKIDKKIVAPLVSEWAAEIKIHENYITVNLIENQLQLGKNIPIFANLYLPSLWTNGEIEKIGLAFHKVLIKYFNVNDEDIFIITSIIESGNAFEKGKAQYWENKHDAQN